MCNNEEKNKLSFRAAAAQPTMINFAKNVTAMRVHQLPRQQGLDNNSPPGLGRSSST